MGRQARSAISSNELPFHTPVEIEFIMKIDCLANFSCLLPAAQVYAMVASRQNTDGREAHVSILPWGGWMTCAFLCGFNRN
jgi:hypothetical protein